MSPTSRLVLGVIGGSGTEAGALAEALRRGTKAVEGSAAVPGFPDAPAPESWWRRDPAGSSVLYLARTAHGLAYGSDSRALLATGWIEREIDASGLSGLVWRGAPVDARLPLREVSSLRPGETLDLATGGVAPPQGDAGAPARPRRRTARLEDALSRAAVDAGGTGAPPPVLVGTGAGSVVLLAALSEAAGAPVEGVYVALPAGRRGTDDVADDPVPRISRAGGVPRRVDTGTLDAEETVTSYLAAADMPSAWGLRDWVLLRALRTSGVGVASSALGSSTLFGEGPRFSSLSRTARLGLAVRALRRMRPGPDPLDVADEQAREVTAFARVPIQRANAERALFPASTRAALLRTGPRPADGVTGAGSDLEIASDVERGGWLVDARLRDASALRARAGIAISFPLLAASVVDAARALRASVRFGRPGSGGFLRALLSRRRVPAPPRRALDFDVPLDAWLRGPLASWLDRALARDRLVAQRVWREDAVAEAVRRFRGGAPGWTARRLFFLAHVSEWLDREHLAWAGDPDGASRAGTAQR